MAKTNWVLDEYVMPTDMNQIGTEINDKAEKNNTIMTGTETLGDRWCRRSLGIAYSLNNSENQKIRISIPSLNFGGNIKLTVLGSYNTINLNGILEKSFTGNLVGANKTFNGVSNYEKVYSTTQNQSGFFNVCQISDLQTDTNGFYFEFCLSISSASHAFTFFIEAKNSSGVDLNTIVGGATLGTFYASSTVLPKAIVQERQIQLTAPQGTAPLIVTSNTKVDNLNVESVNGLRYYQSPTEFGVSVGTENEENIALGMANDSVLIFRKTNANTSSFYPDTPGTLKVIKKGNTGVAFTFTTQKNVSPPVFVRYEASFNNEILTASRWTGWKKILVEGSSLSGTQLTSTAPQGTAPLVVASTTKVENLNVGMVNGFSFFNSFAQLGLTNTPTMQQVLNAMPDLTYLKVGINLLSSTGLGLPSNVEGTLEVSRIYTSRTFAEFNEFNGDKYTAKINSTSIFSGWNKLLNQGGPISGTQLTSTAQQGTAPLVVTSNTKVDNLNSDLLDGFHASQNKDINTVAVRRADGSIQLGGFSEFEQIGIKLPGRNRELRLTQDANNITYIQLLDQNGGFIANPIQVNSDGTVGLNVSTNVIAYNNPNTPQVRNTHVGNTAPSNSLGLNGDMYIEV